jgi:hypothetical protein
MEAREDNYEMEEPGLTRQVRSVLELRMYYEEGNGSDKQDQIQKSG